MVIWRGLALSALGTRITSSPFSYFALAFCRSRSSGSWMERENAPNERSRDAVALEAAIHTNLSEQTRKVLATLPLARSKSCECALGSARKPTAP